MNIFNKIFNKSKEEPITCYSDFWNWFLKHAKQFHRVVVVGTGDKDTNYIFSHFFDKLVPKLNEIHEEIYYLAGMFDNHTVELILTAEGKIKNILFVEELIEAAPLIQGWKFTALKQVLEINDIQIDTEHCRFDKDNISFFSNDNPEYPDEIDITLVYKYFSEKDRKEISLGIFVFLDNLLGELNAVSIIDDINIIGPDEATQPLIPIEKLNDFLIWREKEFVEKYKGTCCNTNNNAYVVMKASHKDGYPVSALLNEDLLNWDSKCSHPWILTVEVKFDGSESNGMPDDVTYVDLNMIEDNILEYLKDYDGYLNVGRQTANNLREIYFACKEFRKPSKVLYEIVKKYAGQYEISFDIYKDKYWKTFDCFIKN